MILRVMLLALTLLLLGDRAFAELQVVTTLPWIGSLARDLGKDRIRVSVLVKPSQDPHMVEPKPSMIVEVRRADLLMSNGLDLEVGYLPVLLESSRNPRIQPGSAGYLDCSQFIAPLDRLSQADRSMGDVHPLGNPHYHLSPANVMHVAEGMVERLVRMDPSDEKAFRANLEAFKERWTRKQGEWLAKPVKGKRYVAYHRFFEYLAHDFSFEIAGYVEPKPGIPPSAGHAERLIEMIKQGNINAILTTSYYGAREVAFISEASGVRYVVVPHDVGASEGTEDWFGFMDRVVNSLL